ncbi:MAG: FG-GAP-like repeat-containing protein [Patescibacteria group bacterium]
MHTPWRRKIYKFPYYLLKKLPFFLKGLTLLFIIGVAATSVDTPGITFAPKITVDAWTVQNEISPNLFGYSTSSEFKYDTNLVKAVKQTKAESIRITDGFDPGARMLVSVRDGDFKILAADNTPYKSGQEYQIKAQVSGSNIKIFIDENLVFNVQDADFSAGNIGLLTSYNQNAYFDNVKVEDKNGQILFSDSFDQKESSMWNNDNFPNWHNLGQWHAQDGKYRHSGKQDISIKFAGPKNWSDYTLTATIKSQSSNPYDLGFIGLVFRSQNVLNSYRFIWRSDIRQPFSSNRPWGVEDFQGQIDFAKEAGLAPIVTVNMRRDSPAKAADLVYQLNTIQGLNIKYWELGNEIYAWGDGYLENKTYAQKIKEFSKSMKARDPNIKVGATLLVGFSDWDVEVIKQAAPYIDFVIFHYYPYWVESGISDAHTLAEGYAFSKNYKTAFGQGLGVVERTRSLLKTYAPAEADRIEFVVTEFNTGDYQKGVSLIYGLTVADLLGAMTEQGVKIGQFHKLAAETDWQWGAFTSDFRPKPTALAISLFTNNFGEKSLITKVEAEPTFSVSEKRNVPSIANVPYLSAYSSKSSDDKKLYLAAVNKHGLADMRTNLIIENAQISDQAKVYTLNGSSLYANNNTTNEVKITESQIKVSEDFNYTFPAHSVSILEFNLNRVFEPKILVKKETVKKTKTKKKEKARGGPPKKIKIPTKIVAAAGFGGNPHIKSFDAYGTPSGFNKFAFSKFFRGGVQIAFGNVIGKKKKEIIAGGGLGEGRVKIFNLSGKKKKQFAPYGTSFRGGVSVAVGNIDQDKKREIATVQANESLSPEVKIYKIKKRKKLVLQFKVLSKSQGANIALGDVDGDKIDEIIVGAAKGSGPRVEIFDKNGKIGFSFLAFEESYQGGVAVAAGDVDGDGKEEIAVSKQKNDPLIKIYRLSPFSLISQFRTFENRGFGANIALGNIKGNKKAEIIAAADLGGSPQILAFNAFGKKLPTNFFAFDQSFYGGLNIAVAK